MISGPVPVSTSAEDQSLQILWEDHCFQLGDTAKAPAGARLGESLLLNAFPMFWGQDLLEYP